ncbi:hypothetical protein LWI28_027597 [Acer negundo]|uniref:Uncharacterized protein n=1 Tax=Acer negundo TaxID=4023 RepID=A0AAD5JJA4_ACENE|nr:hypothetical protein LWI28_027597 [Acer negundo]
MASPPMLGLMEVPMSLEATLVSSPHTTHICGKGTVSSSSEWHSMGNVLPYIPALGENTVNVGEPTLLTKFLMVHDDIGINRSTDDDQRIRAIATGVITTAINDIRPLLYGVPLLQAQLEEVLQRLEALSPNGNGVDDKRRGRADEITRGSTSLTRNPENIPQFQNT